MSTQTLQSLYSQIRASPSASHVGLCVFVSLDGQQFHSYPPSIFGLSPNTFESVLPNLRPRLAVQASSPGIQAAIREAQWPQDEVHLDYSCSLAIVDTAAHLTGSTTGYIRSAAFVRSDGSLVLWGDSEGQILYSFEQILSIIHRRYGTTVPSSDPFATISGGVDLDGSLFNDLPPLVEFSSLATVPPMAPSPTIAPQAYSDASLYPHWPSESPGLGGLQLALHASNASSPSTDDSAFSFGGSPWIFLDNSLNPAFLTNLGAVEEATSDISLVSTASSDGGASPVLSASSDCTTLQQPPLPAPATATGTASFRRHSVGEASAPLGYAAAQKAKRAVSEYGDYVPKININGKSLNGDANVHQIFVSDVRAPKRLRPVATPTSAPALLIPLPTTHYAPSETAIENASVDGDNSDRTSPAPVPTTSTSTTTTTTTTTRRPARRTSSSSSGSGSAHRRPRRRTAPARTKRTQCEYCAKTFSRVQDAQRHMATSCAASPDKAGVECPECGSVLSRLDAAQRHWRGHENPSCEAPDWALPV